MRLPFFVQRWLNFRKPPKPFVPGMTLVPGESAMMDIPVTPELAELMAKGVKISILQQPPVEISPRHYRSEVIIEVDGSPFSRMALEWSSDEWH